MKKILMFVLGVMLGDMYAALNTAVDVNTAPHKKPLTSRAGDCVRGKSTIFLDSLVRYGYQVL